MNIRRRTAEKELRLSDGYVKTKEEYIGTGATYHGSLGQAAKAGYLTIAACQRLGRPVQPSELADIQHFAMFVDCYSDQCLIVNGRKRRPCLPVFYRELADRDAMEGGKHA